ncbi:hypothetical protein GGR88_002511 [Sphingomonas jejuensis]|uniref:Uncharacterized protein n=1 Tax=Sphingomonas jejuensis TaxID=904715 RepID=A0ABX0XQK5_9SPHN|nr:hypothetical protein [Sphingomonas jejuensis]NJC34997.1 hypothetical protein [Sphingomonas jejuensis]
MDRAQRGDWWSRPWLLVAVVLLTALPLLWPTVPPLVDLLGHMGRYHVQLGIGQDPQLARWYSFEWAVIGNLGVDLLVEPLAPLLGLEHAVKLIVALIPPLTAAGLLWIAHEVHHRLPPTAFLAVPLVYNYPLFFGFANFSLAMAFVFVAFGLWLHLARRGRLALRAAIFPVIAVLIWITHAFGWGTLGVLCFSAELIRQHDRGRRWHRALIPTAIGVLPLTPPILLMLLWRGGGDAGGMTGGWFAMEAKLAYFGMILRDRWAGFDILGMVVLIVALRAALVDRRLELSRHLAISAVFLLGVYLLLPRIVFGSAYADMRLAPYMLAVAVIGIRLTPAATARFAGALAVAALLFLGVRLGGNFWSAVLYDRAFTRELAALDHVPPGSTLVTLVGKRCVEGWWRSRLDHIPGMALVRRGAFANDQWEAAGAQLLRVTFDEARPFVSDPSQLVTFQQCRRERWLPISRALPAIRRDLFDHVWIVDAPPFDPRLLDGMTPVWRRGRSLVLRIDRPAR